MDFIKSIDIKNRFQFIEANIRDFVYEKDVVKIDIKESICNNKKIKQFLGFESFISFEEGILKL